MTKKKAPAKPAKTAKKHKGKRKPSTDSAAGPIGPGGSAAGPIGPGGRGKS